ncbi:MAG TPA: alpha/beta hydrolase [Phnomibacter sp.]|nr:alpha/beta hydrolase [Phnomibacter sp.]
MQRRTFWWLLCLSLSIILPACNKQVDDNSNADTDAAVALQIQNLAYGSGVQQVADVYLPANRSAQTTSCVIMLHGGSWVSGDKTDNNIYIPMVQKILPNVAIVNMNYTLSNGSPATAHPAQVNDIGQLLKLVDSKAASWHIKKQYAMSGISAGGQLAMLYSYKYDAGKQIKMVASFVGPTDLTDPFYVNHPLISQILASLIGKTYAQDPALYASLSPALLVNSQSPPTFMVYGGADPLVPVSNPTLLAQNLQAKNVPFQYDFYPAETHDLSATAVNASLLHLGDFWKQYMP